MNSDDKKYRIKHNRPDCIGCTACANIHPERWEMSDIDAQADVIGAEKLKNGWQKLDISEDELKMNMEAAESCPVNVIHLIEIGSNKELI